MPFPGCIHRIVHALHARGGVVPCVPQLLASVALRVRDRHALGIDNLHARAGGGSEVKGHLGSGIRAGIQFHPAVAPAQYRKGMRLAGFHLRDGTRRQRVVFPQSENIVAFPAKIRLIHLSGLYRRPDGCAAHLLKRRHGGVHAGNMVEPDGIFARAFPAAVGAERVPVTVRRCQTAIQPEGRARTAVDRDKRSLLRIQHLCRQRILAGKQEGSQVTLLVVADIGRSLTGTLADRMPVQQQAVAGVAAGAGCQRRTRSGRKSMGKIVQMCFRRMFVSTYPETHGIYSFLFAEYGNPCVIITEIRSKVKIKCAICIFPDVI